jgi:hypothetical protein
MNGHYGFFSTPSNGSPFFGFSILAASHKLVHHPQLAFVTKLLPHGLALHAPVPCHGLFSWTGLNKQQQRMLTGGGGGEGTTVGRQRRMWRWTRSCDNNYGNNNKRPTNMMEGHAGGDRIN